MAEFSGKVVSASFIDAEYSIVKVVYVENDTRFVYQLDVNPDHPDWQALLEEGWDIERITDDTAEEKRMQSAAFNTEVNQAAKIMLDSMKDEIVDEMQADAVTEMHALFQEVVEKNSDKDFLFKFKLWALEQYGDKLEKTQKTSLRKAKSIADCIQVIDAS